MSSAAEVAGTNNGGVDASASLDTSHTQTTTQNQQGAMISTGITFAPFPAPVSASVPITQISTTATGFFSQPMNIIYFLVYGGLALILIKIGKAILGGSK